jgi:hypothetical protein
MDTNEAAGCSKPLAKNSSSQKTEKFVQNSILMSSNKCASLLASSNLVSKFKKMHTINQSALVKKKMCTTCINQAWSQKQEDVYQCWPGTHFGG